MAAAAVAALLLIGTAGCGGSSSDGASSSDGSTTTTQDAGKGGGSESHTFPDPCDLVPIEKASEILGGESADPVATDAEVGTGSKSCAWQTQAGKDDPTLDGAGHILTLSVTSPPETMSMDDFWTTTKGANSDTAEIAGCDEAFWNGSLLNARKDGVYLTGAAGQDPDAKASAEDLVTVACASI